MANRLASSASPYLLQHADNPVDWWEWSDEAFAEAKRRDVPVLLSVGYSACHWCHVMAHESFEDPDTAAAMNEMFVNIKVDREERPDVDSVYMEAVQSMTGQGGWPMTVWLTPDAAPFFAGTYFPPQDRHGLPSFHRVLIAMSEAWRSQRAEVSEQAARLLESINRTIPASEAAPDDRLISSAVDRLDELFDARFGGFGGAPKFPQQPVLDFLLRARGRDQRIDHMLNATLESMARGGIHDQLGGGFARYSVDERWLVPHFEKMLYDNAQLARMYLWAGVELDRPDFSDVARTTLDYLLTDLRHPEGGFFSAEDADSEGVEGKFYVWTPSEIEQVVGTSDATTVASVYGVTDEGNFDGANILWRATPEPTGFEGIKKRLRDHRANRVRPGLDDKVIASWNGLTVMAFAEAGAVLGHQRYLDAAVEAASFLEANLMVGGHLMRSWRQGSVSVPGFLDDHAAVAMGMFRLYSATGNSHWYRRASALVDEILDRFTDPEGGFFDTASDAERLVKRPKDPGDNPLPSGNALAAEALLMRSLFTGNAGDREASESVLAAVAHLADRYPSMFGHHLGVAATMLIGSAELAVTGEQAETLARPYWNRYRPGVALAVASGDEPDVPLLHSRHRPGETLAYLCREFVCDAPVATADALESALNRLG